MLFTMHLNGSISYQPDDMTEIILFFHNKTKTKVETVDKMWDTCSVSYEVKRWSLGLFF